MRSRLRGFTPGTTDPIVIGHRGASGYRPEHTLASYELAARMGADFYEPDLVITADGVLVARHEPEISGTTDIAEHPEFADHRTTKRIDGRDYTGWFTEDLTLAEIKTLRANERIPQLRTRNLPYEGRFEVVTFDELLALSVRLTAELGRPIGVYFEAKHPSYFASLGTPIEPLVIDALNRAGLNEEGAPIVAQSFETRSLRVLREGGMRVPLVQLMEADGAATDLVEAGDPRRYADMVTPDGLAEIATYADGIGPDKAMVIPRDAAGALTEPTTLVADAHAAGLPVHVWTFRSENEFLPANLRSGADPREFGDILGEYAAFFATGIDGLFSDHPDAAVEVRSRLG